MIASSLVVGKRQWVESKGQYKGGGSKGGGGGPGVSDPGLARLHEVGLRSSLYLAIVG